MRPVQPHVQTHVQVRVQVQVQVQDLGPNLKSVRMQAMSGTVTTTELVRS